MLRDRSDNHLTTLEESLNPPVVAAKLSASVQCCPSMIDIAIEVHETKQIRCSGIVANAQWTRSSRPSSTTTITTSSFGFPADLMPGGTKRPLREAFHVRLNCWYTGSKCKSN